MQPIPLNQVAAACHGTANAPLLHSPHPATGLSIDSRTIRPGDVFFCLPGTRHDGHRYAGAALCRGAAACVVSDPQTHRQFPQSTILVDSVPGALNQFAAWYRQQQSARLIGITGSVGKSTTRELLWHALSTRLAGTRSPFNWNNSLGLPLSLSGIEASHHFAVVELGTSAPGEIAALAEIAAPQVAVVTAVGLAHVAGIGSLRQIVREKGDLVAALPADGVAILNGDDPHVRGMAQRAGCRVVLAGEQAHNDLRASDIGYTNGLLEFTAAHTRFAVPVAGRHFLQPALLALATAREFGLTPAEIAEGLTRFTPLTGRCRVEQIGSWTVIDDTYNASPESMAAACQVLADWQPRGTGRRVLVTGDMRELGEHAVHCHRQLGVQAARAGISLLATCGRFADEVAQAACDAGLPPSQVLTAPDVTKLLGPVRFRLQHNDVVLVKGSRALRMERLLASLRKSATAGSSAVPAAPGNHGLPFGPRPRTPPVPRTIKGLRIA